MEQGDLLQAMYSRNGEGPVVVVAATSPADCFWLALESARIAIKYMTPVIFMTDGYVAQGSEPLRLPEAEEIDEIPVHFRTDPEGFYPYIRDEKHARPWAIPGTPGLEHRVGGLEKRHIYGNISYEPLNHEFMVRIRDEKVRNVVADVPDLEIDGPEEGDLLVVGWGSTYGAIKEAMTRVRKKGYTISHIHLRYIHPMPKNTGDILKRFKRIFVPELNLGQMAKILQSTFLVETIQYNKIQGLPFKITELEDKFIELLGGQQ
jgi:2-oxoglutarate ferredoxin oxidoreductase subunit alpha